MQCIMPLVDISSITVSYSTDTTPFIWSCLELTYRGMYCHCVCLLLVQERQRCGERSLLSVRGCSEAVCHNRAGKIKCFTGVDDPYEVPTSPEIILDHLQPDGSANSPDDMAATILDYLEQHGILKEPLRCKAGTL